MGALGVESLFQYQIDVFELSEVSTGLPIPKLRPNIPNRLQICERRSPVPQSIRGSTPERGPKRVVPSPPDSTPPCADKIPRAIALCLRTKSPRRAPGAEGTARTWTQRWLAHGLMPGLPSAGTGLVRAESTSTGRHVSSGSALPAWALRSI